MRPHNEIIIGYAKEAVSMPLKSLLRHGVISGGEKSGKTLTMQHLAEAFSEMGIPVFMTDGSGEFGGFCMPGKSPKESSNGMQHEARSYPTNFWDIYAVSGMPFRLNLEKIGPEILSVMMNLDEEMSYILSAVFRVAECMDLKIYNMADLYAVLDFLYSHRKEYYSYWGVLDGSDYHKLTIAAHAVEGFLSTDAIGDPPFEMKDCIGCDMEGNGRINVLNTRQIEMHSSYYVAYVLFLLREIRNRFPRSLTDIPRMMVLVDDAELMFQHCSEKMLQKLKIIMVDLTARGIGVFFQTKRITDIPETILSCLNTHIMHNPHAYSAADKAYLKQATQFLCQRESAAIGKELHQLENGEAFVTIWKDGEVNGPVKVKVCYPASFAGFVDREVLRRAIEGNQLYPHYSDSTDPISAYEILKNSDRRYFKNLLN